MPPRSERLPSGPPSVQPQTQLHNVRVGGFRTSIRVERVVWEALIEVSQRQSCTVDSLCTAIAHSKPSELSLTSAIRTFLIIYFRAAAEGRAEDQRRKVEISELMDSLRGEPTIE